MFFSSCAIVTLYNQLAVLIFLLIGVRLHLCKENKRHIKTNKKGGNSFYVI